MARDKTNFHARNIGGTTIHSWAGIGLGVDNAEKLASKVLSNAQSRKRWRTTAALVIDESKCRKHHNILLFLFTDFLCKKSLDD